MFKDLMWNMVTIFADTILYLKFAKKVELKWSHQEKEKMMNVLINWMGRIPITMFTKKKKKKKSMLAMIVVINNEKNVND